MESLEHDAQALNASSYLALASTHIVKARVAELRAVARVNGGQMLETAFTTDWKGVNPGFRPCVVLR